MKASGKTFFALIGAMAVGAAAAAPSVEITSVQQQYPWTNTVDIVYNVAGVESETNGYFVVFTPTTSTGEAILDVNGEKSVQVALKGSGVYSTQWFPQTNQQYTACKMTPSVFRGAAKDYMIVDLETGAVTYEPMATQAASNQRYQADEYKTTKLVLRRVPAKDDYYIGGPETTTITDTNGSRASFAVGPNSYHKVRIPQDYYFAIYELTQAQYSRIMGETVSNSKKPKGSISWNSVRGFALPAAVPVSGPFAKLNALTGLRGFDVPTDSMWEIAARAGCTTKWLSGDTASGMTSWGWFSENGGIHEVGTAAKGANAWGIYDVEGNVWEVCRDIANTTDLATLQTNGLVPVTTGSSKIIARSLGGDWVYTSPYGRLSARIQANKTDSWVQWGVRVSYFPQ